MSTPLVMGQSWSLAYEMCFYVTVSVLFVIGWHRRSVWFAAVLLALSGVLANHVGGSPLRTAGPRTMLAVAVGMLFVAAVTFVIARRASMRARLACALVMAVVAALLVNRAEADFAAAFFLGTMFYGTALYRWTQGSEKGKWVLAVGGLAVVAIIAAQLQPWSPWLPAEVNANFHRAEVLTFLAAYAVFAALLLLRHRRFPWVMRYLGTISYSLYLTHSIVLYTLPSGWEHPWRTLLIDTVVTIAVSALTYRFIEKPAIDLGRRFARQRAAAPA